MRWRLTESNAGQDTTNGCSCDIAQSGGEESGGHHWRYKNARRSLRKKITPRAARVVIPHMPVRYCDAVCGILPGKLEFFSKYYSRKRV